jgi:hypothetical protein
MCALVTVIFAVCNSARLFLVVPSLSKQCVRLPIETPSLVMTRHVSRGSVWLHAEINANYEDYKSFALKLKLRPGYIGGVLDVMKYRIFCLPFCLKA